MTWKKVFFAHTEDPTIHVHDPVDESIVLKMYTPEQAQQGLNYLDENATELSPQTVRVQKDKIKRKLDYGLMQTTAHEADEESASDLRDHSDRHLDESDAKWQQSLKLEPTVPSYFMSTRQQVFNTLHHIKEHHPELHDTLMKRHDYSREYRYPKSGILEHLYTILNAFEDHHKLHQDAAKGTLDHAHDNPEEAARLAKEADELGEHSTALSIAADRREDEDGR